MLKSKRYNDIPDNLVPRLAYDEVVHYKSLSNTLDPHGNTVTPTVIVPNVDTIRVEDGDFRQIAYIVSISANGKKERTGEVVFARENGGIITLKGSSPSDANLFQFLELSNFNASNPNRLPDAEAIFERIDANDHEVKSLHKAGKDSEAYQYAMNTDIELLKVNLANRGINASGWNDPTIRLKAFELGKIKPFGEDATKRVATMPASAEVVREAIDTGIIKFQNTRVKGEFVGFVYANGDEFMPMALSVPDKNEKLVASLEKDNKKLKELIDRM